MQLLSAHIDQTFYVGVLLEHSTALCSEAILLCCLEGMGSRSGQACAFCISAVFAGQPIWGTEAAGLAGSGNMTAAANAAGKAFEQLCWPLWLPTSASWRPSASATLAWG